MPYDCVAFSQFLMDMINMLVRKKPRKSKIHIYEFGFGSGLVAKRTMDWIRETDPGLYRRIVYHMSDISPEQVNRIRKKPIWKIHRSRIRFDISDLRNPKFQPGEEPDLVFHTYLLDALDYRMIQVQDGVISEIEIQSTLLDEFYIPDTRSFPPNIFSPEDIRQILESPQIDAQRLVIERRIYPMIDRQYRAVPLEEQHGIPEAEQAAIQEYADEMQITEGIFLFSMDALECTRAITQALPSETLLLMMDYTLSPDVMEPGEYEDLLDTHFSKHGLHLYVAVSSKMMYYVLSRSCTGPNDIWRIIPNNVFLGEHSLFLFYRGEQAQVLDGILQSRFPLDMKALDRFPTELFPDGNGDHIAPLTELNNWTHHSPFRIYWGTYSEWEDSDPEQVAALLDLLDEQFGGPNPQTLFYRAMLAERQENSDQALEILDGLVKSFPLFEGPHIERIFILSGMPDKLRLIQAIQEWISVTSLSEISGALTELVKLYHQTGNSSMVNRIVRHLANQDVTISRETFCALEE